MRKTRKKKKITRKKTLTNELDKVVSWITRNNNQTCEWCQARKSADAHHIFSRRYKRIRHELNNLIALCKGCHLKAHEYPEMFRDFLLEDRPQIYLMLKGMAVFGTKLTEKDLEDYLNNYAESLRYNHEFKEYSRKYIKKP